MFVPFGPPGQTFHLPYVPGGPNGTNIPCPIAYRPATSYPASCVVTCAPGGTQITLVGIRPYSSPLCNPLTGAGCPADGVDVFSDIFTQNTIANSAYNGFQTSLEKRFSHGLQMEAAYTFGKSLDFASTFENLVDPFIPNRTRWPPCINQRDQLSLNTSGTLPLPHTRDLPAQALKG